MPNCFLEQFEERVPGGRVHTSNSGRVLITIDWYPEGQELSLLRNDFSAPPIPRPLTTSKIV